MSLASVKSSLVLPFWYRLTWVVSEKGPLNECVCYYNITSLLRACRSVYLDGLARFDAERVHQLEYLFVVLAGAGRVQRRAA